MVNLKNKDLKIYNNIMGCYDIFCVLCGNPQMSADNGFIENYIEIASSMSEKELNKKKNLFYKQVKQHYDKYKDKHIKKLYRSTNWMNKCSLLLINDKVVHNLSEVSCNVHFVNKKNPKQDYYHIDNINNYFFDSNEGIFIHTDCYNFAKKEMGLNLKFSDLPVKKYKRKLLNVDYKPISKYQDQEFNFFKILDDNMEKLCNHPSKNKTFIKNIINQMKIKKGRTGPSTSATNYSEGDIKIGNNKKFWQVKNKKWVEIQDNITTSKIIVKDNKKNKYDKIPFIGYYNNKLIFKLDVIENKNSREYIIIHSKEIKL